MTNISESDKDWETYRQHEIEALMRGDGMVFDIDLLRIEGVQIQVIDLSSSFHYKGPDECTDMFDLKRRKVRKILKITGEISFAANGVLYMRREPLQLELIPVNIEEGGKSE